MAQAALTRAVEAGRQNRAGVDRHDVMRARRREADLQHIVRAAPCVQHRAPAALAMRVDQRLDRRDRGRPAPAPRRPARASTDDIRPATSAAWRSRRIGAEMLADRRDALVARLVDMHEVPAVGMAGNRLDRHASRPAAHKAHRAGPCGVSAMPSPRWPRRAMVRRSVTRGAEQKFAIAVAARDGRGDDAENAPAERSDERGNSSQTAAWTARRARCPSSRAARPASNCGLISATSCAGGAASASAAGSTSLSEMKLTSMVTRSGAWIEASRGERADVGFFQ